MTKAALLAAALVGLAGPAGAATRATVAERGEAELARMLTGRVAGEPVRCISDFGHADLTAIDGVGFVFRQGRTLYVNRPSSPELVDEDDLPVFQRFGGQYCRLDRVELRDRLSRIGGPVTWLGDFVPYRRPDRGDLR